MTLGHLEESCGVSENTLSIPVPPTLAVVGGGWTAVVARVGDRAVDGTTLGLIDADGRLAGDVLAGLKDDPGAARQYWRTLLHDVEVGLRSYGRVVDALEAMIDRHADLALCGWKIAVLGVPPAEHDRDTAMLEKAIAWQTAAALRMKFPRCVLILPPVWDRPDDVPGDAGGGARYPSGLVSARPQSWGCNEHPHGERAYEQAAYDLAAQESTSPREVA